jgi:hypothetical protein
MHRQYGSAAGIADLLVRRMLHPEQSRQTRKDLPDLPIGEIHMSTENITEIVKRSTDKPPCA